MASTCGSGAPIANVYGGPSSVVWAQRLMRRLSRPVVEEEADETAQSSADSKSAHGRATLGSQVQLRLVASFIPLRRLTAPNKEKGTQRDH